MSVVEQHHKLTYADNVLMVAQQKKNPLMGAVMEMPVKGEAVRAADLLNSVEYVYGEGRSRRNVENPIGGTARWLVRPDTIESGQYIDIEDKLDMAVDPTSKFVAGHTMAVTRGWADRILGIRKQGAAFVVSDGGIMGYAREGKTPGATTALPVSQSIAHGGTGLSVLKLRAAQLKLNEAEFGMEDDGDVLYCMIGAKQKDDLLAIAEASATPLNAFQIQQLVDGKPTMLMGINWIFSNRLPKVGSVRYCPVWSKNNIAVGVWEPLQGALWNDTSAKNLPVCRVWARLDAVRAQDKGVVIIECNEP
jgi:Phage capsid protein